MSWVPRPVEMIMGPSEVAVIKDLREGVAQVKALLTAMQEMMPIPGHSDPGAIEDVKQAGWDFVHWGGRIYTIGEVPPVGKEIWPTKSTVEKRVAEYVGVDLDDWREMKRARLKAQQKALQPEQEASGQKPKQDAGHEGHLNGHADPEKAAGARRHQEVEPSAALAGRRACRDDEGTFRGHAVGNPAGHKNPPAGQESARRAVLGGVNPEPVAGVLPAVEKGRRSLAAGGVHVAPAVDDSADALSLHGHGQLSRAGRNKAHGSPPEQEAKRDA